MKINKEDIAVRIVNLPHTVKGFVSPSPDGTYNIYLNARCSYEHQRKTLKHELDHLQNDDFETDKPVAEIEEE